MKANFFYEGLCKLASTLEGTEHLYLGIRPYGFHAGDMIPHVIYPLLLCQELQRLGKTPKFKIFLFINDWEQDRLVGPNTKIYPFNVLPLDTSFQHAINPDDPSVSIVDYWQPIITHYVSLISKQYPEVSVIPIRNSEMKTDPIMKRYLIFTLRYPQKIAEVFRACTKHSVLDKPLSFALAICPFCRKAQGTTMVDETDTITHTCDRCGKHSKGPYEFFDYWFYHKPLAIPRLEICDIDLCITGNDHFNEGDFTIRQELIKLFDSKAKFPKTLYTPLLLGKDGQIMGKSRGNAEMVNLQELYKLVLSQTESAEIQLPPAFNSFRMSPTIIEEPLLPTA